jgi:hypothetical protein
MKHLLFDYKQIITFHAKQGVGLFESLTEAKRFINEQDLEECNVVIDNYTFNIEKYSDIRDKIKEYTDDMTSTERD